ncbi:MAG: TDT family transporter [Clostridium sp.]
MSNSTFTQKFKDIPVAILPTLVGACTVANVYQSLGYGWIKHLTIWLTIIIVLAYIIKIIYHFDVVKSEYSNTVPASLYAGFTMLIMILGSYVFDFNQMIGKGMWFTGLVLHAIHILIFTYRNVIKGFKKDTFVPSWFVTYNGIMVSTVVGGVMNEPTIGTFVVFYGITVLLIIMPFMLYRLFSHKLNETFYHTQAILLAPSSLCLVSYFNYIKTPNTSIVYGLYALILITLLFILFKIPKFFSFNFHPGFAGLTFPMAIGIVASVKMSAFLATQGLDKYSNIVKQISGIQLYLTTIIVGFVAYKLLKMLNSNFRKKEV